jgi:hypothetical protein
MANLHQNNRGACSIYPEADEDLLNTGVILQHLDLLDGEAYKFINVNKDSTNNWTWSKTLGRWVYSRRLLGR